MSKAQGWLGRLEMDAAWEAALENRPSDVDRLCAQVCAEAEAEFLGSITWERLAPLYGMEAEG